MITKSLFKKNYLRANNRFKFFSTNNITNELKFPNRSIDYFLNQNNYAYIDKTLFFEKVLNNTNTEIFYQPDSFGKSFNLDLFRFFISNLKRIDNIVDYNKRIQFFEKTEIYKNQTLIQNHFLKHPVIYLNFKELDEIKFEDNIEKLKLILNSQIEQIFQNENYKSLNNYELKVIEDFISNIKTIDSQFLTYMPKEIAKVLSKISQNNAFILINNFDYPLINSFGKKSYEDYKQFLETFFKNTFKNNNYIYKGILTGVNEIEHDQIFKSVINSKAYLFKENNENVNKFFGVNTNEDVLISLNTNNFNLNNNTQAIKNFISSGCTNNISFKNFLNIYQNPDLKAFTEENLMRYFNIENVCQNLNLDIIFSNMVNTSSKDYLSGYKLINILNNKAEVFVSYNIHEIKDNASPTINHTTFSDYNLIFEDSNNKNISFDNPLEVNSFISYLLSNDLIYLKPAEKSIEISSLQSALLIKNTFSKLNFHLEDYDRRLANNFYKYLYFNKLENYFNEIKDVFEASFRTSSTIAKKIKAFTKTVNLNFKNEKELENYFVHIMTLELNVENSKENLNIYKVDDYDNIIISDLLKEFTLITFDDRRFAIFIRFNKYKSISSSSTNEGLNEIDEVQKNEIISKNKKRIPKVDLKDVITNMKTTNEEKICKINEDEAVKFLKNISDNFESISFVSINNYKNNLEYAIKSISTKNDK